MVLFCKHQVICPKLPSDFLGPTVGYFEDLLLSLFTFVIDKVTISSNSFDDSNNRDKYIILFDGLEHILGGDYNTIDDENNNDQRAKSSTISSSPPRTSNQSHLSLRVKSIFLTIIDKFKMLDDERYAKISNNLLVICTARQSYDGCNNDETQNQIFAMKRFDKHFHLGNPMWEERYQIIRQCLAKLLNSANKKNK